MTEQLELIAFTIIFFGILLTLKHLICEFILQPHDSAWYKTRYASINRFKHVLHHSLGTMMVGLILEFKLGLTLGLVLIEFILHYHIDWLHAKFDAHFSQNYRRHWQWLGIEQFLHHQTYIIMIILAKQYLIYYS